MSRVSLTGPPRGPDCNENPHNNRAMLYHGAQTSKNVSDNVTLLNRHTITTLLGSNHPKARGSVTPTFCCSLLCHHLTGGGTDSYLPQCSSHRFRRSPSSSRITSSFHHRLQLCSIVAHQKCLESARKRSLL